MASNVLVPDALGSVDAGSVDIALFAARGQIQLLATRWSPKQSAAADPKRQSAPSQLSTILYISTGGPFFFGCGASWPPRDDCGPIGLSKIAMSGDLSGAGGAQTC